MARVVYESKYKNKIPKKYHNLGEYYIRRVKSKFGGWGYCVYKRK